MENKMDAEDEQENPVRSWKRCKDCADQTLICVLKTGRIGFCFCVVSLGIFKLTFGILYLHDCKLQPLLPVYLIVEFCIALFLFIHIFVCKSDKEEKSTKRGSGTILTLSVSCAITRLVSVLLFLFLFIWLIVGTVWVVTLREEINAPGHCRTTTATATLTKPSSWNSTNNINPQNPVSFGSKLTATVITNQTEFSAASADCSSCNEILLYFTFGVVIAQWIFFGPIFAIFIGGYLYFAVLTCLFKLSGGYFEFVSESEDVETDSPTAGTDPGV